MAMDNEVLKGLPPLCDTYELAKALLLSPRTLEQWRHDGIGPPYIKEGRIVRYMTADVVEWLVSVKRHQRMGRTVIDDDVEAGEGTDGD